MRQKRIIALLLSLLLLWVAAGSAGAASMHEERDNPAFDMQVILGYDGQITYGKVFPIRVRIRNNGADFRGRVGVNTYYNLQYYNRSEASVDLPGGTEKEIVLPAAVYSKQTVFTVELTQGNETVMAVNATPEQVINPSAMLVGVLSTRPGALSTMSINRDNDTLMRYEYWQTIPLTTETFPDSVRLMNSFGILVVDDVDLNGLSAAQQETLSTWLENGKILIIGGGAAGLRNLQRTAGISGLEAEGLTTSESVLTAMEDFAGARESEKRPTVTLAKLSGGEPLFTDENGQGLLYQAKAGGGSLYTMAWEAGDPQLSAEAVSHFFWQATLVSQDSSLYNTVLYGGSGSDESSPATVYASSYLPIPAKSYLLVSVLLIVGGMALGCLLWVILKKKDRRQWMWLGVPLLALAVSGGIFGLSTRSEAAQPMMTAASTVLQETTGRVARYTGYNVAVPGTGTHTYSADGETLMIQSYDYYYDEGEDAAPTEPTKLRYSYVTGQDSAVTVNQDTPWEALSLYSEHPVEIGGQVDTAIWMERDGLHGEIRNGTDATLAPGMVLTIYGYVLTPALAPGEKTDIVLEKAEVADPQNPTYLSGKMYRYNSQYTYSMVDGAVNELAKSAPEIWIGGTDLCSQMVMGMSSQISRRDRNSQYGYDDSYNIGFLYVTAQLDRDYTPEIRIDEEPVRQMRCAGFLGVEMNYESIGRTGVVFHADGTDPAVRVTTDEQGMPQGEMMVSGYARYYHPLSETPTFRIQIQDAEQIEVETIQVVLSYYDQSATAYALDPEAQTWEEIPINKAFDQAGRFVTEDGMLYIQFRPGSYNSYDDIPTPGIILEGRARNAAD